MRKCAVTAGGPSNQPLSLWRMGGVFGLLFHGPKTLLAPTHTRRAWKNRLKPLLAENRTKPYNQGLKLRNKAHNKTMKFEWDHEKRETNIQKHGIDFLEAFVVFADEHQIIEPDTRKDYGEPRYLITGQSDDVLLTVVFTERSGVIRLISVRKASIRERKYYERRKDSTRNRP